MDTHRYLVVFERSATGYGAYAPDVPGCVAAGATLEDTAQLMREALVLHLEALAEDGLPIPEPSAHADLLDVQLRA